MRRTLVLVTSAILTLTFAQVARAHDPTGGENEYTDGVTVGFRWDPTFGVPNWLATAFESAAEVSWASGNNSDAPRFQWTGTGPDVRYRTNAQMPATAECPDTFWYACTDYNSGVTWQYTVFNSAQNALGSLPWYWCQDPAQPDTSCIDAGRTGIHELGHVVGLSRQSNGHSHQPDSAMSSTSVMQLNPIKSPDSRYNDLFLGQCDEFELQREYDVLSLAGTYATCVDHAVGTGFASGEIETVVVRTSAASITLPCVTSTTSITGTLTLSSGTGLGRLAGNQLPGRAVVIERRVSGGAWASHATVTTNSSGNFSRIVSTSTPGTWEFRGLFSDGAEVSLDGDDGGITTVTWNASC